MGIKITYILANKVNQTLPLLYITMHFHITSVICLDRSLHKQNKKATEVKFSFPVSILSEVK